MLLQLFQPCIADEYALLLWILRRDDISLGVSICDDLFEVICFHCSKDTKEELSLWEFVRELLLGRQILCDFIISHRIVIEVGDRDLRVVWNIHDSHFMILECFLLLTKYRSQECNLRSIHAWKE